MNHNVKPTVAPAYADTSPRFFSLGTLESEVLGVVCESGGGSVGDVRDRLSRPFAYTTVMTTLDRLYKKDLLERQKAGRRFVYAPKTLRAADDRAVGYTAPRWPVLALSAFASHLLDAVGSYDEALLQELEKTIANRRLQFEQEEKR
jgi:predicted transcriptional regulator